MNCKRARTTSTQKAPSSSIVPPLDPLLVHRLSNSRIVQRNMLYIIGLPPSLANEELLLDQRYCGQYGKISRVLVKDSRHNGYGSHSAYVTYESEQSASIAVLALNNFFYDGSRIYASYGTNKYCLSFLKYGRCKKSDCLFKHKIDSTLEVRQDDNKKHFQEQQQHATQFLSDNYSAIDWTSVTNSIFPSVASVRDTVPSGQVPELDQFSQSAEQQEQPTLLKATSCQLSKLGSQKLNSNQSTECSPRYLEVIIEAKTKPQTKCINQAILKRLRKNRSILLMDTVPMEQEAERVRKIIFEALSE